MRLLAPVDAAGDVADKAYVDAAIASLTDDGGSTGGGSTGTVLASETWAGGAGAAWPAQFTIGAEGGTATQTGSGKGVVTTPATIWTTAKSATVPGMTATLVQEFLGSMSFNDLTEKYVSIALRSDLTKTNLDTSNGYILSISPHLTTIKVARVVAGVVTDLGALAPFTFQAGQDVNIRFHVDATHNVRVRMWYGATEPSTWLIERADATPYNVAGRLMMTHGSGPVAAAQTFSYGPFTVTDTPTTGGGGGGGVTTYTPGTVTTLPATRTAESTTAEHTADHAILAGAVNYLTAMDHPLFYRLGADATRAATTVGDITGLLPVAVAAGATYAINFYGVWRASATTAYLKLALGGTATATSLMARAEIATSNTALTNNLLTAINALSGNAVAAGVINTDYVCTMHGTVVVNAAGTFGVRMAAGGTGTLTMRAGSYFSLIRIA